MRQRTAFVSAFLFFALFLAPPPNDAQVRSLSFEDRLQAQEAIERRVRTYLEQSVALERLWDTPITSEALRIEWERIASNTRYPDRLREIAEARSSFNAGSLTPFTDLALEFTPSSLWPPNHRLVDVQVTLVPGPTCGSPTAILGPISSTEPDDAPGPADGDTIDDIRGSLSNLQVVADAYELGDVSWIESNSTDESTAGFEDPAEPAAGGVYFYLVQYHEEADSGYGTECVLKPRIPGGGDCM